MEPAMINGAIATRRRQKEMKAGTVRTMMSLALAYIPVFTCEALAMSGPMPCERELVRAAAENLVPIAVLYAVALTETGQQGSLHAYAMNIEGRAVFAETMEEALKHFAEARRNGAKLIDIGCMQVNHYFHAKQFRSIDDMFDPRKNVAYAAKFLRQLRASEGSWTAAVARYHAGPGNAPAQKSYVCAVIANMIVAGFGKWTRASETFCNRKIGGGSPSPM